MSTPPYGQRAGSTISAVVLAYLDEPWLEKCVYALLDSERVDVEVILVDNGCTDGGVDRLRGVPGVQIVGEGHNLGFSGGCNVGAAAANGEYLVLVNGDLIVHPDALVHLVDALHDHEVGAVVGSVRLSEDPDLLNSAGNEIHFLGFSWVGHFRERADTQSHGRDVAGAMGAFLSLRKSTWERLGGFDERFFAFHEDAELSWRCWQTGTRVRYVPNAIGVHRYEFSRVGRKLYLAERNRLIFVLTMWERRTLVLLGPAFVAVEAAVALAALKGGWFREKAAGWRWILRNRHWLASRRQQLQGERTVGDRELASLMVTHLDAGNFPLPSWLDPLDDLLASYWAVARRFLASRRTLRDDDRLDLTSDDAYADRLVALQHSRWKRLLPVQAPYRWNLRRLELGHVLDVGCGIGRNLANLSGQGVGVDHNPTSVSIARSQGFQAFTPDEFLASTHAQPHSFDSLLLAHILEHMSAPEAVQLVRTYLPYLRPSGTVVLIAPQERGFRSDPTHVEFLDVGALSEVAAACQLRVVRSYSFPFPRFAGRAFPYNEFVVIAKTP